MTGIWYIFLNGKVDGPKDSEEIRELLWTGDISNADPIFKMGGTRWHLIREIEEFQPRELQALNGQVATGESDGGDPRSEKGDVGADETTDDQWVVLSKRVRDNRSRFLPVGPFSQRQIVEKIHSGELKFTDYVWKEGWSGWVKILDAPSFRAQQEGAAEHDPMTQMLNASPAAELAQVSRVKLGAIAGGESSDRVPPDIQSRPAKDSQRNFPATPVIAQKAPVVAPPAPVPMSEVEPVHELNVHELNVHGTPEDTVDFEPLDDDKTDSFIEKHSGHREAASPPPPAVEDIRNRATDLSPFIKPKKSRARLGVLMFTLSVLFLGLHFLLMESPESAFNSRGSSARVNPAPKKTGETEVAANKPSSPENAVSQATKDQLSKLSAPQKPNIKIVALKLDGPQPQLVLETNAEPNEMIEVDLTGRTGEILDVFSFANHADIKRSNYELPILDLSQWHLPKGTYRVTAKLKGVVDEREIFIGQKDQAFERKLSEHKKQISYRQQLEKLTVVALSQDLASQLKELQSFAVHKAKKSAQGPSKKLLQAWVKRQGEIVSRVKRLQEVESAAALAYPELLAQTLEFATRIETQGEALSQSLAEGRVIASDSDLVDPSLKQTLDSLSKQAKSLSSQAD